MRDSKSEACDVGVDWTIQHFRKRIDGLQTPCRVERRAAQQKLWMESPWRKSEYEALLVHDIGLSLANNCPAARASRITIVFHVDAPSRRRSGLSGTPNPVSSAKAGRAGEPSYVRLLRVS